MPERIAVYPGSFDPPTYGHLDLIERATRMFDQLIVGVARNDEKSCLFTADERVEMLKLVTEGLPGVEVTSFEGLTADFARTRRAVALVRGLRVISDFEFELTMAITNEKLNPEIDTVCLMPSERYLLLSSRLVREVARFGGDVSLFVPPEVEALLRVKLGRE
ncbi:MAG: pantetheine-phosphate adenylyltransferase [Candidatus Hydrogenedentes bacterium]|nr:pantetheine-phosphate adenylyltransferase [Candidatus Hydrogenedentota bacterium]